MIAASETDAKTRLKELDEKYVLLKPQLRKELSDKTYHDYENCRQSCNIPGFLADNKEALLKDAKEKLAKYTRTGELVNP